MWKVAGCGPVLWSRQRQECSGPPLIFSLGFGASMYDYALLAELFGQHRTVYRVAHRGSSRWAGLAAAVRLLGRRYLKGESPQEAARTVRAHLHRPEARRRRLEQLWALASKFAQIGRIDLAGHSFGTDTALMLALEHGHQLRIGTLYLFSPHPPGYLIDYSAYAALPVEQVVVISGTRDRTRDGVGPEQRLQVLDALGPRGRKVMLDGVGHMDFAYSDLGPPQWPQQLADALNRGPLRDPETNLYPGEQAHPGQLRDPGTNSGG